MKKNQKIDFSVLLGFTVTTHLFYFQTIDAGFVKDFTGLLERFDGAVWRGFLTCFDYPGLHQVTNFFLYLIYSLFELNALPWYLFFTSLHILNSFVLFKFSQKVLSLFQIKNKEWIALTAAILFLLNPYHTEVLVWRVCANYLISTFLILSNLYCLLTYLTRPNPKYIWWNFGLLFLAIFTFELALIVPFLTLLILIFFFAIYQNSSFNFKQLLIKIALPQFSLLAIYFPLNRLIVGTWVGHYGAEAHLNFSFTPLLGNFYKYFLKNLIFLRDLPHLEKQPAIRALENDWNIGFISFLLFILFFLAVFYFKRLHRKVQLGGLFFIAFFIALLPIMNLYFGWTQHIEGDRYGYLAAGFFFLFLMVLISFLPKYLKWSLFIVYLICSSFFLYQTNQFWQKSTEVYFSLLDDYRWTNADKVYILACPDNFEGAYLFKDYSKQSLAVKDALTYNSGKKIAGNIQQVAQFNIKRMTDGVSIEIDQKDRMTVKFNQWGNWWWRNGKGASNYETEDYKFWRISNGYRIQFKSGEIPENGIFIYADGKYWKEVKFE